MCEKEYEKDRDRVNMCERSYDGEFRQREWVYAFVRDRERDKYAV